MICRFWRRSICFVLSDIYSFSLAFVSKSVERPPIDNEIENRTAVENRDEDIVHFAAAL